MYNNVHVTLRTFWNPSVQTTLHYILTKMIGCATKLTQITKTQAYLYFKPVVNKISRKKDKDKIQSRSQKPAVRR